MNAPLTSRSTVTGLPGGSSSQRKRIASFGPVGSHWTSPAIVEREGELDGRVARQLAVGVAVAAIDRQQRPVASRASSARRRRCRR